MPSIRRLRRPIPDGGIGQAGLANGVAPSPVRVRYLQGRPGPHPLHRRFGEMVGAEFAFMDFRMPWQDRDRSRLYTVASWLLCSATMPQRREHDVFIAEGLQIAPVLMKRLFLRRDQKIVLQLACQVPYFLLSHRFSRPVERLHLWALRNYDAIICVGGMMAELVQELTGGKCPPTYEVFGGASSERLENLRRVKPDLASRRIVFVGGGRVEHRMHYKGLDLMVEAVSIAAASDPDIEFDILGDWDDEVIKDLLAKTPATIRDRIHFRGRVDRIADWFGRASLYLHCARGDAFPVATIEAMNAGLVPLVSELTGTREIVREVSNRLTAPLDAAEIAGRISWYFALDEDARQELSDQSRDAAASYTEDAATAHYRATFATMCQQLGLTGQLAGPV